MIPMTLRNPLEALAAQTATDMREPSLQDMCADPVFLAVLNRDGLPVSEFRNLMLKAQARLKI